MFVAAPRVGPVEALGGAIAFTNADKGDTIVAPRGGITITLVHAFYGTQDGGPALVHDWCLDEDAHGPDAVYYEHADGRHGWCCPDPTCRRVRQIG